MKKIIFLLVLAACIIFLCAQPEAEQINIENNSYSVFKMQGSLYAVSDYNFSKLTYEKIIDYKLYDIDSDKNDEILVITEGSDNKRYGEHLIIYDTEIKNEKIVSTEVYRQDFSDIKPWKVDACNLDNDGYIDIFIGVNKDTMFYKDVRNRPFFYSWNGEKLIKKWQGSYFSNWFLEDIAFGDYFKSGHDYAAVLEKNDNNEYRVGIYSFTGFGFLNVTFYDTNCKNAKKIITVNGKSGDAVCLNFGIFNMNIDFSIK